MQPSTPRLSGDVSAQPGYAPIAWTAVAALALAGGFVLLLLFMFAQALAKGVPLSDEWLPFVPALAVALAFVARRQIRASEGTRTGEVYANAAWWLGVVSLIGLVAYQVGVRFTVQREAAAEFRAWADSLKDIDPFNPKDPNLYAAALRTLPPGARPALPKDGKPDAAFVARMDQAFGDAVNGFRQTDVARVCGRNRGRVEFTVQGLENATVRANETSCVLTATLTCPEGEYGLRLPMRAAKDDKGVPRWQIQPAGQDGYIKSRTLTRAGWDAVGLEADGARVGSELVLRASQPNQAPLLYLGFVQPGWTPARAVTTLNLFAGQSLALAAGTGMPSLPEVRGSLQPRDRQPLPAGWYDTLTRSVFAKPDGSPHTPADAERIWRAFSSGGQLTQAGQVLKSNPDTNPVLAIGADTVEVRLPVELATGAGGAPSAYKGRLVFRLPPDEAARVIAERAAAEQTPRTSQPPEGFSVPRRGWRLVRLETDLKAVQAEAPKQGEMPGL